MLLLYYIESSKKPFVVNFQGVIYTLMIITPLIDYEFSNGRNVY